MPYFQARIGRGYLTRSLELSTKRIRGYPTYDTSIELDQGSVRTILYEDNDIIYLTSKKRFILTLSNNYMVFTSNMDVIPFSMENMQERYNVSFYSWNDLWANMDTDEPNRTGLIWPAASWDESWLYAQTNGLFVSIRMLPVNGWTEQWMAGTDAFGKDSFIDAAIAWRDRPDGFRLDNNGKDWTLRVPTEGSPDANSLINLSGPMKNLWVKNWVSGASNRWLLTNVRDRILFFNVQYRGNNSYIFTYGGKRLNKGGHWQVRPWPISTVNGGVEFFNNKNQEIVISMHIIEELGIQLNDLQKYLLNQNEFITVNSTVNRLSPMWKPERILANLPRGGASCSTEWDGLNASCYTTQLPYESGLGYQQCSTLDDLSSDIHCQQWAIRNKGPTIDTLVSSLCENTTDEYPDICTCYRNRDVYYDTIRKLYRSDPIANSIRTTNTLQCSSRLCMGTTGTVSEQLYYREGRKCDVCIQVSNVNIQDSAVRGDIITKQVCIATDATYTWKSLLNQLRESDIDRYIRIASDESSITLLSPIIQMDLPLLKGIDTIDENGDTILYRSKWLSNPIKFYSEVIQYYLEARE